MASSASKSASATVTSTATTPATDSARFACPAEQLRDVARAVLQRARDKGASACEVEVSEGYGQTVTVRRKNIDTIEYNRDKGIGVTVYLGQRKGYASSSDFSAKALADTVDAALSIARFTAEDDAAGLAPDERLCRHSADLDLFHPWDPSVEHAAELARRCESAAFALDKRIRNSDGASVSSQHYQFVQGNSQGFLDGFRTSRHHIGCGVIASEKGAMQRDDWHATCRNAVDFPEPERIGDYAGRRALARLRSRKIDTTQAPVLFEAPVANGLLGQFVGAVSGGSLYRKTSFLTDSLGKQVFARGVNLSERPHLKGGLASSWFDDEGVLTCEREVLKDGVLHGYFLGSYSARKLGMQTTGNAGGSHNLVLHGGKRDLAGMIRHMRRGLLVTELMGQGVNMVTGDYSRGAAGYWIEGGEIAFPVEEVTIAGNLREMFLGIADIGSDALTRGSRTCGSILVEQMTIAGN